ncbi:hypothetical protein AVEN_147550-1 [Araneus ventricosus]|uniref:Uncharacterized protein n=1 Tax=Araneus ventricosus TaxID=182803 RepID=A0A4Y2VDS0_ARAVE|nr:hypothetical protein AVEN_147550-1 [Araneus ventricosus]
MVATTTLSWRTYRINSETFNLSNETPDDSPFVPTPKETPLIPPDKVGSGASGDTNLSWVTAPLGLRQCIDNISRVAYCPSVSIWTMAFRAVGCFRDPMGEGCLVIPCRGRGNPKVKRHLRWEPWPQSSLLSR